MSVATLRFGVMTAVIWAFAHSLAVIRWVVLWPCTEWRGGCFGRPWKRFQFNLLEVPNLSAAGSSPEGHRTDFSPVVSDQQLELALLKATHKLSERDFADLRPII